MINANKSPKIPYSIAAREVEKWYGIPMRGQIIAKSEAVHYSSCYYTTWTIHTKTQKIGIFSYKNKWKISIGLHFKQTVVLTVFYVLY